MRFRMIGTALGVAAAMAFAAPAMASHDIPSKANKFLSLFVRAYAQCTSPSTTHNAPLAFSACTPVESSGSLRWGPKGFGQAKGVVKLNSLKDATDVQLIAKFIDVHTNADVGFNGNLTVAAIIRTTDHYCATGPSSSCTLIDVPFPIGVPCGSAAVPALPAGKCLVKTSANTVLAGAVVPGKEGNVELQQLQVFNGVDLAYVEGLLLP